VIQGIYGALDEENIPLRVDVVKHLKRYVREIMYIN